jgi:replication factor C subunit 2/4
LIFQEANSRVTRFILICNYVTRIIAPLASRCAKFRFQALPASSMKARLEEICQQEQCSDAELVWLDDILRYADGDMRRAVTTMQSVHALVAGSSDTMTFSSALIAEMAGVPPPPLVQQLWEACTQAASFDAMHRAVQDVMAAGCSAPGLLSSFVDRLLTEDEAFDELQRAQLAIRIAEAEKNMIDGADEYLQLMTVCSLLFSCAQAQRSAMRQ